VDASEDPNPLVEGPPPDPVSEETPRPAEVRALEPDAPSAEPEDPRHKVAVLVLLLAILLIAWILYGSVMRDRDLERGKEHFAKQRHAQALDYFLKSAQRSTWMARPEVDYLIGISYERLGQSQRAGDFFMKIMKEAPGTDWDRKARSGMQRVVNVIEDDPRTDPGSSPLVAARKELHVKYNRLLIALRENTSGVSPALEKAYREYKLAHEAYKKAIREGLEALDRGGP
jgi:tetratricopeptide (TPR) repeat protein